jgi:hypothetical protein
LLSILTLFVILSINLIIKPINVTIIICIDIKFNIIKILKIINRFKYNTNVILRLKYLLNYILTIENIKSNDNLNKIWNLFYFSK